MDRCSVVLKDLGATGLVLKRNSFELACVVVNFGDTLESAEVELEGISGEVDHAAPFQADHKVSLPARITIPPRQLAVVVKS